MIDTNPCALPLRVAAVVALLVPGASAATQVTGHMVTTAQLHAGPSTEYPRVTVLHPGAIFRVHGCEEGYTWCDVEFGSDRGWVDAAYIQADSANGPVIVAKAGATLGVPIVAFDFNSYWQSYYRARAWYVHRDRFLKLWKANPHGRAPPPPRPAGTTPQTANESSPDAAPPARE